MLRENSINKGKCMCKRLVCLMLALVLVLSTDVTVAKANDNPFVMIYEDEEECDVVAGSQESRTFTLTEKSNVGIYLYVDDRDDVVFTMYDSTGELYEGVYGATNTTSRSEWMYEESGDYYICCAAYPEMPEGTYTVVISYSRSNSVLTRIATQKFEIEMSHTKADIAIGYKKKLSVVGAKVEKWTSSKKSVATVDQNGTVTAKKIGKTTIKAKLDNGQTLKCVVRVKTNQYSVKKPTLQEGPFGDIQMVVYAAKYDAKGNLFVRARIVNNSYYDTVTAIKDVQIVAVDEDYNVLVNYTLKNKKISVPPREVKDISFTIKKSALKKKKIDLRNVTFGVDGDCDTTMK